MVARIWVPAAIGTVATLPWASSGRTIARGWAKADGTWRSSNIPASITVFPAMSAVATTTDCGSDCDSSEASRVVMYSQVSATATKPAAIAATRRPLLCMNRVSPKNAPPAGPEPQQTPMPGTVFLLRMQSPKPAQSQIGV